MRLADVLAPGDVDRLLSPAVVYSGSSHTHKVHALSYQGARFSLQQHEEWLKDQVHVTFRQKPVAASGDSKGDRVIIVAYLSANNSADFILSVLAASGRSRSTALAPFQTIPALLNSRWSAREMVQALDSANPSETTLLLYEAGLDGTAQSVVEKLSHPAFMAVIPSFCHQHIQPVASQHIQPVASHQLQAHLTADRAYSHQFNYNDLLQDDNMVDEDAVIIFTSGTTGGAKGVRLSARGLLLQAKAKLDPPCGYSSQTRWLATTVPLLHVGGLNSALAVWMAGGTWVFPTAAPRPPPQPRDRSEELVSQPPSLANCLQHQRYPITTLVVVPAMLHAMIEELKQHITPLDTFVCGEVQVVLIGAQSAPLTLVQQLRQIFPNARLVQTYACTEASSSLTFHTVFDPSNEMVSHNEHSSSIFPSSTTVAGDCVGSAPPHIELQLFPRMHDASDTRSLQPITEPFRHGIIATRGYHLLNGYWTRGVPQTARPKRDWFLTNDLGCWDEQGLLYFVGRVKDTIRTGGETVLASEVERVLLQHPVIAQCAVFPLPDTKFGEAVAAAIVLKSDYSRTTTSSQRRHLDVSVIRSWCHQCGLAGYKRPRRVYHVDDLPRNSSGKVLKYRLVERFGSARLTHKL